MIDGYIRNIIWETNSEPPKSYIWIKSDGNAYEWDYDLKEWEISKRFVRPDYLSNYEYGTTEYWNLKTLYIPKEGEIIVYTDYKQIIRDGETVNVPGIKIGNGVSYCGDLPFTDAVIENIADTKQDIIPDLSDIRFGAASGSTAYQKPVNGIPKTDLESDIQASLNKADTAIQSHQDISGKADKVSSAINGDLASLNSEGNLIDSGKKTSDFATASQGEKADTAYQKPQNGIPSTDLSSDICVLLDKADTAYQKPSGGIPKTDLADDAIININTEDLGYNSNNELQIADRIYNNQNPNGLGHIIVRQDIPFGSQITQTNTIYEIRYNFDLSGQIVTIPTGCTLKFTGGKLRHGTIVGNSTKIEAGNYQIFEFTNIQTETIHKIVQYNGTTKPYDDDVYDESPVATSNADDIPPSTRLQWDNYDLCLSGTWDIKEFPVAWYGGEVNNIGVDVSAVIRKILKEFWSIFPAQFQGVSPFDTGCKITFQKGVYWYRTTVNLFDFADRGSMAEDTDKHYFQNFILEGANSRGTIIQQKRSYGEPFVWFLINMRGTSGYMHHMAYCLEAHNICFVGGSTIKIVCPYWMRFINCCFFNQRTSIALYATINTLLRDCYFINDRFPLVFDSEMGGGGVSTTFLVDHCHIQAGRVGFYLTTPAHHSFDGFEFTFRDTVIESCKGTPGSGEMDFYGLYLNSQSPTTRHSINFNECYFENNKQSYINNVDCYFQNCLDDPTDAGFTKYSDCVFYWSGYQTPKAILYNTELCKQNTFVVCKGRRSYENNNNHILKTQTFCGNDAGKILSTENKDAYLIKVKAHDSSDYCEGTYVWNGQKYVLKHDCGSTMYMNGENDGSLVFRNSSGVSNDLTLEAWFSGYKDLVYIDPLVDKLAAKYTITEVDRNNLRNLLGALGAGSPTTGMWPKIKALHFPVLASANAGVELGYDLISDSNKTLTGATNYPKRGAYPINLNENTGNISVNNMSDADISFFGIMTFRGDLPTYQTGLGRCLYDLGYRIYFNKTNIEFYNASTAIGNFPFTDLDNEVPVSFAMSKNVDGNRTICKDNSTKTANEGTPNGAEAHYSELGSNYNLCGSNAYGAISVLGICEGLTSEEAARASTALAIFAGAYGILGSTNPV